MGVVGQPSERTDKARHGSVRGIRTQAKLAATAAIDVWLRINKSKPKA
jgi:hypothetical protein